MPSLSPTKAMPRSWHSLARNGMEIYLDAIWTVEIYLGGSLVFWSVSRVMALPGMEWNGMLALKQPLVGEKGRHRVLSRGEGQTNANWKFVLILDQQLYSQHYSGELQRARKFHQSNYLWTFLQQWVSLQLVNIHAISLFVRSREWVKTIMYGISDMRWSSQMIEVIRKRSFLPNFCEMLLPSFLPKSFTDGLVENVFRPLQKQIRTQHPIHWNLDPL